MKRKLFAAAAAAVIAAAAMAGTIPAQAAGISAAEDSSDFVADCNDRAGYDYLGSMEKGSQMQQLYDSIYDEAVRIWNDTETEPEPYEDLGYHCFAELDSCGLDFMEASIVYYVFRDDNPLFYFLNSRTLGDDETFYLVSEPDYVSGSRRAAIQADIEDYVRTTAAKAEGESTVYGMAKVIHDAVNEDLEYAFEGNTNIPSDEEWAHNLVGPAEKGSGVCEAYARTFQLLMNYLDVENYLVVGEGDGTPHAWNALRLDDGKVYFVDCTTDDLAGADLFFAKGNETMSEHHKIFTPTDDPLTFMKELPETSDEDFDPETLSADDKPQDTGELQVGDINGDGMITVTDISMAAAHVKGLKPLEGDPLKRADISGDDKVTVTDVSKLAAIVKGIG